MKKLLLLLPLVILLGACDDQHKQKISNKQVIGGNAVLPPKYLSIDGWQKCIGKKDMGTWKAICMPKSKPAACSDNAWKQFTGLTGKDKVPDC